MSQVYPNPLGLCCHLGLAVVHRTPQVARRTAGELAARAAKADPVGCSLGGLAILETIRAVYLLKTVSTSKSSQSPRLRGCTYMTALFDRPKVMFTGCPLPLLISGARSALHRRLGGVVGQLLVASRANYHSLRSVFGAGTRVTREAVACGRDLFHWRLRAGLSWADGSRKLERWAVEPPVPHEFGPNQTSHLPDASSETRIQANPAVNELEFDKLVAGKATLSMVVVVVIVMMVSWAKLAWRLCRSTVVGWLNSQVDEAWSRCNKCAVASCQPWGGYPLRIRPPRVSAAQARLLRRPLLHWRVGLSCQVDECRSRLSGQWRSIPSRRSSIRSGGTGPRGRGRALRVQQVLDIISGSRRRAGMDFYQVVVAGQYKPSSPGSRHSGGLQSWSGYRSLCCGRWGRNTMRCHGEGDPGSK